MLDHYLKGAIEDIQNLIDITNEDIEYIINAKHQQIFERTALKEDILNSFQTKKSLIDNELFKIKQEHGELSAQTLPADILDMLDELSAKFKELKEVNKRYAKFVLSVTEFYNSLLDKVVPKKEGNGYGSDKYQASFLKVKA
jgi:hypothetical protein